MLENIRTKTTEEKRKYVVQEPNYHTTNFFSKILISHRDEKNVNVYEYTTLFRSIYIRI